MTFAGSHYSPRADVYGENNPSDDIAGAGIHTLELLDSVRKVMHPLVPLVQQVDTGPRLKSFPKKLINLLRGVEVVAMKSR